MKQALVIYFILQAVAAVYMVDREREPITPATAAIMVLINILLVMGIMYWL